MGTTDTWIAEGKAVQIQGYTITSGLFYLGENRRYAINDSCAVACPDYSAHWLQFDGEPRYDVLTSGQRAGYLNWLAHDRLEPEVVPLAYVELLFAGLEHRLFLDGKADIETVAAVADLLNRFPNARRQLPLTAFMHFWGYFDGGENHCKLLDWLLATGHHIDTQEELTLVLLSLFQSKRPVTLSVALDLVRLHSKCNAFSGRDQELSTKALFVAKFNDQFPVGLMLNPPKGTKGVPYRAYSRNLAREVRLAGGPTLLTWDVADVWTGNNSLADLVRTWSEIFKDETSPKVTVDMGKVSALTRESRAVQQFLAKRLAAEDTDVPKNAHVPDERTTNAAQKPGQLQPRCQTILRQLIQCPSWTRQDFARLAKAHGLMPSGLIQDLNAWAMEAFQDRLLLGEDHITVNQQLISKLND